MPTVPTKEQAKNSPFTLLNLLNFTLIGSSVLLVLWKRSLLPKLIPLYYSRPWGNEQLAPNLSLSLLPLSALIIFLINYPVAKILLKKEEVFFAWLGNGLSLLFTILSTITLWKIIFLIT